jgi:hypothetical protein
MNIIKHYQFKNSLSSQILLFKKKFRYIMKRTRLYLATVEFIIRSQSGNFIEK